LVRELGGGAHATHDGAHLIRDADGALVCQVSAAPGMTWAVGEGEPLGPIARGGGNLGFRFKVKASGPVMFGLIGLLPPDGEAPLAAPDPQPHGDDGGGADAKGKGKAPASSARSKREKAGAAGAAGRLTRRAIAMAKEEEAGKTRRPAGGAGAAGASALASAHAGGAVVAERAGDDATFSTALVLALTNWGVMYARVGSEETVCECLEPVGRKATALALEVEGQGKEDLPVRLALQGLRYREGDDVRAMLAAVAQALVARGLVVKPWIALQKPGDRVTLSVKTPTRSHLEANTRLWLQTCMRVLDGDPRTTTLARLESGVVGGGEMAALLERTVLPLVAARPAPRRDMTTLKLFGYDHATVQALSLRRAKDGVKLVALPEKTDKAVRGVVMLHNHSLLHRSMVRFGLIADPEFRTHE
jgi:hypothetical protein